MRGSSRIGMLLLALAFAPAVARGQQTRNFRVGLYFDADAQSCVTSIANFDSVRVWAFAFVGPETQVNGAILRLELPPNFRAETRYLRPPKAVHFPLLSGDLTSNRGLDMTWQQCVASNAVTPVELFSFRLEYLNPLCQDCPVPNDVVLQFAGGTGATDSTASIMARVKLCPDDPVGGHGELIEAPSLRATLNCTTDCPCTLGVQAKTWAEIKQLYREP
jgi:hypothetical protein